MARKKTGPGSQTTPTDSPSPVEEQKASPRPGPKPAEVKPSDMTVGELRAMLAEKFPDARPDELSHQLLGRRSRLPASCLHPRAEVCLSVEVPSATVDWFNEIALRLWPSRLPQT